jgi:hypothetical protein
MSGRAQAVVVAALRGLKMGDQTKAGDRFRSAMPAKTRLSFRVYLDVISEV